MECVPREERGIGIEGAFFHRSTRVLFGLGDLIWKLLGILLSFLAMKC
jgi:hypothetical protein